MPTPVDARAPAPMAAQLPAPGPALSPALLSSDAATSPWDALASEVRACQACKLCVGRRAPVFAPMAQARQVDWLILGEPPDEDEERAASPFAGEQGQLLDNMLFALGLKRNGTGTTGAWLSKVVKCRPGMPRSPEPADLAACAAYLRREIALVRPRIILAMGRFAAQSLLQECAPDSALLPLGKQRGQVYRYQGLPLVVTYAPDVLLRTPLDKAKAWVDLCLARDALDQAPQAAP